MVELCQGQWPVILILALKDCKFGPTVTKNDYEVTLNYTKRDPVSQTIKERRKQGKKLICKYLILLIEIALL